MTKYIDKRGMKHLFVAYFYYMTLWYVIFVSVQNAKILMIQQTYRACPIL